MIDLTGCCEVNELAPTEQGYLWCVNCGAIFQGVEKTDEHT